MTNTHRGGPVTAEAIEAEFGGRWGIWLSGAGRWWAVRHEERSAVGPGAAGVLPVRADDPDQLKARIQEREASGR